MKYILCLCLILSISSCVNKKWDKESMLNQCLGDLNKKNEIEPKFTSLQIGLLCDCISNKMIVTYNSDAEAGKDPEGAKKIGSDCAQEILAK